ncbi:MULTISPECIES: 1,4-alpha-glucan branching protein GlgB [Inquilinus]|uniref:1,4-alpha-glucan branching enzyme GlgB n=1 Tax=Inquilinus ginsengisoli TaxID=363840 RepID=A0ABU1JG82_9PROT|nr:1,4-alpha-glucan branching protein GlgB [Inquilinus ginsengisoli]MDR6287593.1 1,4-alpha-glucan branching enzyme [Inquilinus ginsengisoli]
MTRTAPPRPPTAPDLPPKAGLTDAADVAALVASDHRDPFGVLGPHPAAGGTVLRCFRPDAAAIEAIDPDSGVVLAALERRHPDGVFDGRIDAPFPARYRLRIDYGAAGGVWEVEDPYRFPSSFGELDLHLLGEGTHLELYERLGAHPRTLDGVDGTVFAVWAPNARRVAVVGDFNRWDGRLHPMRLHPGIGVWEIFLPGIGPGATYKFEIRGPDGTLLPPKTDPFAFRAEHPPATASIVHGLPRYDWDDAAWMDSRAAAQRRDAPISVYEVHPGSWRRVPEEGDRPLSWRELGDQLIPYAVGLGFTHIELMPISEFPFDGSWGYQPIGLYAPTSRFGPPEDFAGFVDRCHRAGLGVLLDWVPGHFPTDEHGLARFDGTALYEHADPRQGMHQDWGTLIYNYGRAEVRNFLLGNALFWLDRFHVDGLRVDAVASMLYLDYSRKAGEWVPNRFGGRENLEAVDFLRQTNVEVFGRHQGVTTVAEESTAWPAVSRPAHLGGLGFGYKWNMGWMNDTLRYMQKDPIHRTWHHSDLTFGLLYAFSENFVLPLSHDEVVHGKGSMLGKMPGDDWQKFANLRAFYGFMWAHPGKKLLFMGGEFAQPAEWSHDRSLDWHLLGDERHAGMQRLIGDLNRLYREVPALHARDCEPEGFAWIDASNSTDSILAWLRLGHDGDRPVLAVSNFTPVPRQGYRIGVPHGGRWIERLNTDAAGYGGSGLGNFGGVEAEASPWHGQPHSLLLTLPPLATVLFEWAG